MKANKIVYTSNTGFTRRYAEMLGKATGLPVYDLAQSPQGGSALYLGWLRAGKIHGLARARKKHLVTGCCAVGLTDRPPMEKLSAQLPEGKVFYLRGGYDHGGQHGLNCLMMTAMICFCANCGLLLPCASPAGAMLHGNKEWVSTKEVELHSLLGIAALALMVILVGIPFGNIIFG